MPQASPRPAPAPPPAPLSTCPSPASPAPRPCLTPEAQPAVGAPCSSSTCPSRPRGPRPHARPSHVLPPSGLFPGSGHPLSRGRTAAHTARRLPALSSTPVATSSPQSSGDRCCSSGTEETRRESWVTPEAEQGRHRPDARRPRTPGQCCPLETPVAQVPREKGVDLRFPMGL